MQLGFQGKIIAFFLLLFAIYGIIWEITEPLTITWIVSNPAKWRIILFSLTGLFTLIAFIFFFPKKVLEKFGASSDNTNLQLSVISNGNPEIKQETDGFQGKISILKADYIKDEMDWHLKPSANRAKYVSLIYSPNGRMVFYLRVILTSKEKTEQRYGWIKFDPYITIPDKYNDSIKEMMYPINVTNHDNFIKLNIDVQKAVRDTFGQGGWLFGKIQLFRIRGNGKIKEVVFR